VSVGNNDQIEKRLWDAADELRANSKLKSSEYSIPVLGLIFLRYADQKFTAAQKELEGKGTGRDRSRSPTIRPKVSFSLPTPPASMQRIGTSMRNIQKSVVGGEIKLAEREMPTNAKETKGVGKALINALGFFSFLFGLLILLGIVFTAIGSIFIFISKSKLFQFKRMKMDEDNSRSDQRDRQGSKM
jgi:type I restriction enzyme M protein